MAITVRTLENENLQNIASVFNLAFADYFVPVQVSAESLLDKIAAENIMLNKSQGIFLDETLAGFLLTGIDETNGQKLAYNAGTGVLPHYRGNHFTQKMYEQLIPLLEQEGIVNHQLEVVVQNEAAIMAYTKIGFVITARLLCFRGKVQTVNLSKGALVKEIKFSGTTQIVNSWQSSPSWQNSTNAILRNEAAHVCLAAFVNEILAGYIVFAPANYRVKQLQVNKDFESEIVANALFQSVNAFTGNRELSIINVNENDTALIAFLLSIGMEVYLEQFEMKMAIR